MVAYALPMGPEMTARLRAYAEPSTDDSPEVQETLRSLVTELDALAGDDLDIRLREVGILLFRRLELNESGTAALYSGWLADWFEGKSSTIVNDEASALQGMDIVATLVALDRDSAQRNREAFGGDIEGRA